MVQGQPREKTFVRLYLNGKMLTVVVLASHPSYSRKCKIGG
jgi:hypothetical protein